MPLEVYFLPQRIPQWLFLFVLWDLESVDMRYNLEIQEDKKQLI